MPRSRPLRGRYLSANQSGLVLIALLLMLMLVGVGALAAGEVWATARKREREIELLWIGDQYRHAIQSYWKATPGARKILPSSVDQLLEDDRFPTPVHHLRQRYRDPMTESGEFELIVVNNALVGVHSTSTDAPMKHANFPRKYVQFEDAQDYSQWQFIFLPPATRGNRTVNPSLIPNPGPLPGLTGQP
jgi:hypothetical protein